jgi:hypothetical protein
MVAQVITIVNQSGKVVKSSKHLVNVFKEAKSAYDEKKAEIKAFRRHEQETKERERQAIKQLERLRLEDDDNRSRASSRHSSRDRRDGASRITRKPVPPPRTERPPVERGYSDSFYVQDMPTAPQSHRPSPLRQDSHGSWRDAEPRVGELARRHTTDVARTTFRPSTPKRSSTMDDIDMDLAYGELPPPLPDHNYTDEVELRSKMNGLQRLLDECNCLQHSVTATIDNLQKNPDALAAVALTLAEISNLASKLAPGALATMKGSFPAVIALLASPEFAIAAGVGVGVTIIALGGYKIIKKIKARKDEAARMLEAAPMQPELPAPEESQISEPEMDELREIDRIEVWRRGIADAEADSLGTSVDGEFITPVATRTLIEEGRLTEADLKSTTTKRTKHKSRKSRSESGSKTSKAKTKTKVSEKSGKKKKEPSGLRMLFKTHA